MPTQVSDRDIKPFIERVSFSNTKLEKLERGDILYFGYSGDRQDTIIDPCIIFSGLNKRTGYLEGVNMRMFYVDRLINLGVATLEKYGDIYWSEENNEEDSPIFHKKVVGYTSSRAFTYDNLRLYESAKVTQLQGNKRIQVNLMEKYWRSYNPIKMRLLNDPFTKLSNNNISVNIQVANAIIHAAPTQINLQTRIEA